MSRYLPQRDLGRALAPFLIVWTAYLAATVVGMFAYSLLP